MSKTSDPPAQEALLSTAVWNVLARRGVEGLTLRRVAETAGCTTGLLLHRFPHRRALLLHARELLHNKTKDRVELLETQAQSPQAALRAVLLQGLALDDETRVESLVWLGFLASAVGDDELISLHRNNNQAWLERITRLVGAARPTLDGEQRRLTAITMIALVEGAAALASADPTTYSPATQTTMLDRALAAHGLI